MRQPPVRGGTGSAGEPIAHLSIDSVPPGAVVAGPDGEVLGKTPLKLDWPISDLPVTFELRLAGYKKKQKQTVINGNTALHIELERALPVRRGATALAKTGSGRATAGNADELMRPRTTVSADSRRRISAMLRRCGSPSWRVW